MNSFAVKFAGAAVIGLVGFVMCTLQTQWIQLLGIVLMMAAVGMGVMGDFGAKSE